MPLYKKLAGQKLPIFAWDAGVQAPKTGDAANITARISKDGGASAATNDANPTELDATNMKGIYLFDITETESNADMIALVAVSATAGVRIEPVIFLTLPSQFKYSGEVMHVGVVNTANFTPTTTECEADGADFPNDPDRYNHRALLAIHTATLRGEAARITDYSFTNGRGHFFFEAMSDVLANGDLIMVV